MHIVVYSHFFYPSVGGVESTSRTLCRAIVELGHSATLLTRTGLPDEQTELNEGYQIRRNAGFQTCFAASGHADVVISKGGTSVTAGMAALSLRKPLVLWHEMYGQPFQSRRFGNLTQTALGRLVFRSSALHIAVSQTCLESKCIPNRQRKLVIYNPVAPELQQSAMLRCSPGRACKPKDYDILFVGRLIRTKGIFVLADALARLWSNGLRARVAIAGDGPDAARFKACVKGLNVTFLGAVDWTELADVYARSRMLVLPSISPEGMGMVLVEGFAFGLPAITSDQPGMGEITQDAGIAFTSGGSDSLAHKLGLLLSNESLYHSLSQKALCRAERFSYPVFLSHVRDALILVKTCLINPPSEAELPRSPEFSPECGQTEPAKSSVTI